MIKLFRIIKNFKNVRRKKKIFLGGNKMMDRVKAKESAKIQLKGRWGGAIVACLVLSIAIFAMSFVSLLPFVGWIITAILGGVWPLGMAIYTLRFANGESVGTGDIFGGFNNLIASFCVYFLTGLFTFLWSLLLIIPGIIKAISYSMSYYVLADNPELSAMEAINKSKEITQGHKWDIFVTYLSFIGWTLLASLTLGIGYLWLVPYMNITMANIYNQLNEKQPSLAEMAQ